ncbi:MAG: GNAT family N-acetyltransferase, partial [bacterium]
MENTGKLIALGKTTEELASIDSLRGSIGWGAGSWFLGAMVADGGVVLASLDDEREPVAMGGASNCGSFGFVCNMVVRPEMKRRGLGRTVFEGLMSWHREQSMATVQLEATEEGKPLYEQYGFSTRWESVSGSM